MIIAPSIIHLPGVDRVILRMAICGSADFVDSFVFVNLLMVDALLIESRGSGRCVALDAIAAVITALVFWPVFCD